MLKYIYIGVIMEDKTVDYKEMYLKLFRATETAIRVLVEAQQECEEAYLAATEPPQEKNEIKSAG